MNYNVKWIEFVMNWRFTDSKYSLLPKLALDRICPLSLDYSQERWNYWISDKSKHLMLLVKHTKNICQDNLISNDCGWGDKTKERLLKEHLAKVMELNGNEPITFFWGANCAVETEWNIFLEYWSDFCYPSDDSNIIIFHTDDRAIIYIEDMIWAVERKSFFRMN